MSMDCFKYFVLFLRISTLDLSCVQAIYIGHCDILVTLQAGSMLLESALDIFSQNYGKHAQTCTEDSFFSVCI